MRRTKKIILELINKILEEDKNVWEYNIEILDAFYSDDFYINIEINLVNDSKIVLEIKNELKDVKDLKHIINISMESKNCLFKYEL